MSGGGKRKPGPRGPKRPPPTLPVPKKTLAPRGAMRMGSAPGRGHRPAGH
jgi:hypothetical protein